MKVQIVYNTYTILGDRKHQSGEEIVGAYLDYELALEMSKRTKERFEENTGFTMRRRFDEDGCYIFTDDNMRQLIEITSIEVE